MFNLHYLNVLTFSFLLVFQSCTIEAQKTKEKQIIVGAEQISTYLPLLQGKRVALIVNQTSVVGNNSHLVDTLMSLGVDIKKVFAPEHGFRGEASAGEKIDDQIDKKTKLPIYSLYGKNKKPSKEQLENVEIVLFDIQDVGARFYTYISTMFYAMQSCAENNKTFLVLDRPNPNGHYVAGPVLEKEFTSFVGIITIPVVHGCTVGELAKMINGENWLGDELKCTLSVIPNKNYSHQMVYNLPIKPSPNLPNRQAILLYPSLCFFEAVNASIGRGTDKQFQVIGFPQKGIGNYSFTPVDKPGAINPVLENVKCYGVDLSSIDAQNKHFTLSFLFDFYKNYSLKSPFFTNEKFFNLLMGNSWVLADLKAGKTEKEIEKKWLNELDAYKLKRLNYLLYP